MTTQDGETQLTLRIDLQADPITGSLSSAQGATRRFSGWIGLAAALEAIRAETATTAQTSHQIRQRHHRNNTIKPS